MCRIRNAKIMNMFSFNCHTDTLWTNFYYFQTNRKETEAQERVTSQSNLAKATEIVSYKAKSEINLWDTKTTLSLTCTEWSLTWEVWGNETWGRPVFPPGISIFLTPWFPVNVFQVDLQLLCYFVPSLFYLRAIVELYPPKTRMPYMYGFWKFKNFIDW